MKRKTKLVLQASAIVMLATGLAGCGSTNYTPTPTPTQTAAARQEDLFGIAFGNAFRGDSNSEPFPCKDGDLFAVSLTAEPFTIT